MTMDPQLKSILTTVLASLFASVATWLISKGIITADQGPVLIQMLVGAAFALGAAGVAWLKSRNHTPAALAAAAAGPANAPTPGVSVTIDRAVASPALVATASDQSNSVKMKDTP